jgi:hypothetical protein
MNPNAKQTPSGLPISPRGLVICAVLFLLIPAGILIYRQASPEPLPPPAERIETEPDLSRRLVGLTSRNSGDFPVEASASGAANSAPLERSLSISERQEQARELVAALVQFDLTRGALTPEQIEQWKQNLHSLVQQGAAAVPAIREFLEQNMDINFGTLKGGNLDGYSSLRIGLIEALNQIGGPEALSLTLETLQMTADPLEIARLTRNLEQIAPGEYQQTALRAAHEALALALTGQIAGRDVGPLFKVLEQFGDFASIEKIVQAQPQWRYYGAMALAGLPDGEGIPALVQMVTNPNVSKASKDSFGFQMLAQVAPQYPQAREALIAQARGDQIPNTAWPSIASALGGEAVQFANNAFDANARWPNISGTKIYHLEQNQNFASTPLKMSPEQAQENLRILDQLLAVTTNPAAVGPLNKTRASLSALTQQ